MLADERPGGCSVAVDKPERETEEVDAPRTYRLQVQPLDDPDSGAEEDPVGFVPVAERAAHGQIVHPHQPYPSCRNVPRRIGRQVHKIPEEDECARIKNDYS